MGHSASFTAVAVNGAGLVVGLMLTAAIGLFFVAYPAEMDVSFFHSRS